MSQDYATQMQEAIAAYVAKHGHEPKVVMLGEDIWRERADSIAEGMNRTGKDSGIVVHRSKGDQGIHCAEFPEPIPGAFREDPMPEVKPPLLDPFDL
jgi:hypothetical protein